MVSETEVVVPKSNDLWIVTGDATFPSDWEEYRHGNPSKIDEGSIVLVLSSTPSCIKFQVVRGRAEYEYNESNNPTEWQSKFRLVLRDDKIIDLNVLPVLDSYHKLEINVLSYEIRQLFETAQLKFIAKDTVVKVLSYERGKVYLKIKTGCNSGETIGITYREFLCYFTHI